MAPRIDLLLIDDQPAELRDLVSLMTAQGLNFSIAVDGKRGYWQATLQHPRLILLDLRMPGIDGYTTCRMLKADPTTQAIPVLFLSAADQVEQSLQGFEVGAADFIRKPFHPTEVMARILVHLQNRPSAPPTPSPLPLPQSGAEAVLVAAAQNVLRQRMHAAPGLDQLARLVGSNRRSLNLAFQSVCGCSAYVWLREERLQQARSWLCDTAVPIALIGDRLGFSSPANFAKAFRERYGCSPSSMRQQGGAPMFDIEPMDAA